MSLSAFRTQLGFRSSVRPTAFVGRLRTFTSTPMTSSSTSSRHDNDPDTLAKEKARNLSGTQGSSAPHKENAPGWNEHLATDSEAQVKADHAAPSGPPSKEMQDATVAQTHEHHHSEAGSKGAKAHEAKKNAPKTGSEDAVKADRGEH